LDVVRVREEVEGAQVLDLPSLALDRGEVAGEGGGLAGDVHDALAHGAGEQPHQLDARAGARRIQDHRVDPAAACAHPVGDVGRGGGDLREVLEVLGGQLGGAAVALDGDDRA